MTRRDVERFFRTMAATCPEPLRILLIGGGAAIVQSQPRETEDLDFEIKPGPGRPFTPEQWERIHRSIEVAKQAVGIKVQFAEEVARWSMIPWPDYHAHVRRWKQFGAITVSVLEPEWYAISKLARGMDSDHDDIVRVMKQFKGSWRTLSRLAGRALREAPVSDSLHLFRAQVERFFTETGPRIWGSRYPVDQALALFQKSRLRKGGGRRRKRR